MNYNYKTITIKDAKEIKKFEVVTPLASKKYVPIYSSEVIRLLEPEFKFVEAVKFSPISSAHYFDLVTNDNKTKLRIYNSYDRKLALRVSLVSDGMTIPLGVDRLVHIGAKAQSFTEDFTDAKEEIIKAIDTAKVVDTFLKDTTIYPELAEVLTENIFTLWKSKNSVKVNNPADNLIDKVSIKEYLTKSINIYLKGAYTFVNKDGKTLKGAKEGSVVYRLRTENKVIKVLKAEFPELFL